MTVEKFIERFAKATGIQIEVVGATRSQASADGLTFEVGSGAAAAAACEYAWTPVFVENDGEGNDLVRLNVGRFNNDFLVTLEDAVTETDTDILEKPTLAIPDDDLYIGYLEVVGTPVENEQGFITGFTVETAKIKVGTSVPSSTSDNRYLELWRWYEGALFNQSRKYNLLLFVRDNGLGTGTGTYDWLPGG